MKIFMRSDQYADQRTFSFPDASKLRMESVPLYWRRRDVYGLMFQRLWTDKESSGPFRNLVAQHLNIRFQSNAPELPLPVSRRHASQWEFPSPLREDETIQEKVFSEIAGEFMGTSPNKGKTYSWLFDHLADAAGETTPQSFLFAIGQAAKEATDSKLVITHRDIKFGVQDASEIRLKQLEEDHWWVNIAMRTLEGLVVPASHEDIEAAFIRGKAVKQIFADASKIRKPPPLLLASNPSEPAAKLLEELINMKVVERRTNGKINMPDLFRIAAKVKRKGEVRPPLPPGRR